MCPVAEADGHDGPGLVDEPVPGVATVGEDVVVGHETRFESQFSRMNRQTFSTGLSSGDRGGSGSSVMLPGTVSLPVVCQPA